MNKLHWYMRAVVVTALGVVGTLGVYKGRNLLSDKSAPEANAVATETASAPLADATGAASNSAAAPTTESSGWFGWLGFKSSPKVVETPGKEIGPASGQASSATAPVVSQEAGAATLLGKLKFGSGGNNLSDTAAPPPPSFSTSRPDDSAYGSLSDNAPPPAAEGAPPDEASAYAAAVPPGPALPEAGGGDFMPAAGESIYAAAPSSPPEGSMADDAAAAPRVAGDEFPMQNGLRSGVAANETLPPEGNASPPPSSPLPLDNGNNSFAGAALPAAPPTTFAEEAPAAPPAAFAAEPVGTLAEPAVPQPPLAANEYVPVQAPQARSTAALPSPLEASVPSAPVAPVARYADEIPQASAVSVPVDPQLQGPQAPSIVLEKFAPPEVQVGRAALFEILVRNVGKVPAFDVQVVDEIPRGTRYQEAQPAPSLVQGTKVIWKLGAMQPGDEKVIEVRLVPEAEGEIGSVAQVSFQAQVGAKSVVTRPRVELRAEAPQRVHAGENITVGLAISNGGSGAANGVRLEVDIPPGLVHPAGPALEYEVGMVPPGETKSLELVLRAEKAGQFQVPLVVRGESDVQVQQTAAVEVIAPALQLTFDGPTKRFVERQSTHQLTIANPGTAPAKNVEVMVQLPRGLKFIAADQQGEYDARQHAVYWGLEELPPNSSGAVQLTTLPIEAGEQALLAEGQAGGGLSARGEFRLAVDAISELPFTVADLADPIEVNSETIYEIRVANRGAKASTNVRVTAQFPAGVRPLAGGGAAQATVAQQLVTFAPVGAIEPGSEAILKISAQGLQPGDHRIAITVVSDEHPQPVTREEGTRVYLDR